jgi:hypothetical protein
MSFAVASLTVVAWSMERIPTSTQRRAPSSVWQCAMTYCGASGLDGGRQFGVGELRHPDRVRGRGDAAGDEHLDVVRALPQLLARDAAHLVHPVDHLADYT